MFRIFSDEISNPKNFVVTLELVPGRESGGRSIDTCLLYTSPSPRDVEESRMPSSA